MFYNGVRLGDILAWGFGLNDATGNHIDGGPVIAIVRRAGIAADASAVASISATNLSTVYPAGLYEVVFSVSSDVYSLVDGANYLVYAYASASGLSTVACIGGFRMAPPAVNVVRVDGASVSAAVSAIVYVAATSAMRDVGVTSANAVSVAAKQALTDYDVPTSADVSAIMSAVGYIAVTSAARDIGLVSAQAVSVVAKQALVDYDVPTSADVSVIVAAGPGGLTSAACSVIVAGALANYDVPTSADVSAIVAAEAMTSASASALFYTAALSALRAVGVLSAQAASVVAAQALADYDVPTSADVSAIVNTSWKITTLAEPADVPAWASATPANVLAWLGMLATNRMVQTSAITRIQNAAGVEIASASVAYDGTTFTRGPWVG